MGPNQVPYCYICRTLVYTLCAYTEELLHTTFDANSCTNGQLGATMDRSNKDNLII